MYYTLIVGIKPIKLRINIEEQYVEIWVDDTIEPLKVPFDDPYDVIKIVEQYTTLNQSDIQKIISVCNYVW